MHALPANDSMLGLETDQLMPSMLAFATFRLHKHNPVCPLWWKGVELAVFWGQQRGCVSGVAGCVSGQLEPGRCCLRPTLLGPVAARQQLAWRRLHCTLIWQPQTFALK